MLHPPHAFGSALASRAYNHFIYIKEHLSTSSIINDEDKNLKMINRHARAHTEFDI